MAKIDNNRSFNKNAELKLHTKPLVHRIPSTMPATNEAQFKFPKENNHLFSISHYLISSLPLSLGTVINLLTRHSRSMM